ncbi:2,5-diamino-6-(ribosylamino)-4(3H)-pyrimidinone 5'-phosphate reductase [Archaeoglobus profundus]|uniref:2,5-diamino-6-(ribosylamino)-4(3H)-pyrimidinone 5'-phosphate reductase n=1 Tax=Archaeoglobus profundus (strain DSM 5631 / JCM 9629 / NBRC 100127 / Av18) TaxID=572546 RepID=D2RDB9_ARCPA|nr:2,5-diamino-6-(ribosylamino)-4(3H)-pyrimidinone 5'-phosphate reductase [Archaeoglobus profundus]ADB58113.1 2,5-diamino-6-hydroxy-4-(5-phosphoribosylamino) pyrimidine1-reductase [Archaeoglobus profundus DSM 5631]
MRPFTFINVASSVDGKISNEKRIQLRISCEEDLKRVDELRAKSDAIMVGIGTVLSDNPKLTVKSEELRKRRLEEGRDANPIRVVVDSKCRIPLDAKVLDESAKTIVAVSRIANSEKVNTLRRMGVDVFVAGDDKVDLKALVEYLYKIGVRVLMVEGGATLNWAMLREGLVDEIYVYYGNMIIGGSKAPTVVDGMSFDPPISLDLLDVRKLGRGILTRWRVLR